MSLTLLSLLLVLPTFCSPPLQVTMVVSVGMPAYTSMMFLPCWPNVCACRIKKHCNKRGQHPVAVAMKRWSVARHDDRDGTELFHRIVVETQTSDGDASGSKQMETDGWAGIKKRSTWCKRQIQEAGGQMRRATPLYARSVCMCERLMDGLVYTARGVHEEWEERCVCCKRDMDGVMWSIWLDPCSQKRDRFRQMDRNRVAG